LPVALSNANWNTTAALSDTNFSGGQLAAVDPRLDWTVGRDKVPYKDWTLHSRSWIRDATYSGPYSPKKNVHEKAANAENNVGWQATQTNDVNIHLYRFADLLLMNAEAHIHASTGVLDSARVLVNLIRARAGKTAQGCGAPADSLVKAVWPTCVTNAAGSDCTERRGRAGLVGEEYGLVSSRYRRRIVNACRESAVFATSTALPAGVFTGASPATSRGARKPLSSDATGVK